MVNRKRLRRFDDLIARAEDFFLAISHGTIAVLVMTAVLFRYVFDDPLIWTEEVVMILFSWMLFIGLANGFRQRMHLRIDALLIIIPEGMRILFGAIALTISLMTLGCLSWIGAEQALMMLEAQTPMMRISAAWALSSVPFGAVLSCVHLVCRAVYDGPSQALWPANLVSGSTELEI